MKYLTLILAVCSFSACTKNQNKQNNSSTTSKTINNFSEMPEGWGFGWMIGKTRKEEEVMYQRIDTMEAFYKDGGAYLRVWDNDKTYHVMATGNPSNYNESSSEIIAGVFNTAEELVCYIRVYPHKYKLNGVYIEQEQTFNIIDSMVTPQAPFNLKIEEPGYKRKPLW